MLQIKNISKTYKTGNLVQRALDDVSLNLRDNEFVAILGPRDGIGECGTGFDDFWYFRKGTSGARH